jgi:hypothetical protein
LEVVFVSRSSYAVQGSPDMVGALQSLFQKRTRCEGLHEPVPQGSSATVVGELPLIVRGDSVVLPFASDKAAATIIAWLDLWAFLRTQRVQFVQDDEDAEEADYRSMHGHRLFDLAGNSLYVNKHQSLLQGLNQSVLLRTVIPEDKRRVIFPEAFTMSPSLESAVVYQSAQYIFRKIFTAHQGLRRVG